MWAFCNTHSDFHLEKTELNKDTWVIKQSNKVLGFADKMSNIYKLNTDAYKKLTTEADTSTYKKVPDKTNEKINTEGKKIMENKTTLNRIFVTSKNCCFITLKDHKLNFLNKPKTRLLNPAKNEPGRISIVILNKINLNLPNATKVCQWKNTNDNISRFKTIQNKQNIMFNLCDIKDFYPIITKELLSKCLRFAECGWRKGGSIWCSNGALVVAVQPCMEQSQF